MHFVKRCFWQILKSLGVVVNSAYVKAWFWWVLQPPQQPYFLHPCLELRSLTWPPFSSVTPPPSPPTPDEKVRSKTCSKKRDLSVCYQFADTWTANISSWRTELISMLLEKKHLKGKGLSNQIRWLRTLTFTKNNLINTMAECEGVSAFVRCNLFFM